MKKISKKVGKGMIVAGLVGIFGGIGSLTYFMETHEQHPRMDEISQQITRLENNYGHQCISPYSAVQSECDGMRKQYQLLSEEKVQIERSGEYKSLKERNEFNNKWVNYSLGGLGASTFLGCMGAVICTRRIKEEWREILKVHNEGHEEGIDQVCSDEEIEFKRNKSEEERKLLGLDNESNQS